MRAGLQPTGVLENDRPAKADRPVGHALCRGKKCANGAIAIRCELALERRCNSCKTPPLGRTRRGGRAGGWHPSLRAGEAVASRPGLCADAARADAQRAYAAATELALFGRTPGVRLPAYATAIGRVLLGSLSPAERSRHLQLSPLVACRLPLTPLTVTEEAELLTVLGTVARKGYAYSDQDLEIGVTSLGVPIRGRSGAVTAAISVSFHSSKPGKAGIVALLPALQRSGGNCARLVGPRSWRSAQTAPTQRPRRPVGQNSPAPAAASTTLFDSSASCAFRSDEGCALARALHISRPDATSVTRPFAA